MLWELGVTEQRYQAVLEVLARVPVTLGIRLSITSRWLARISYDMHGSVTVESQHKVVRAMRLRAPRTWAGRLVGAGVLLLAAGIVMLSLPPPTRAPGKVVATAGSYILSLACTAWLISLTIRDLRREPEGTVQGLGPLGTLATLIGLGTGQAVVFLATQGNAVASPSRSAHVNRSGVLPRFESFVLAECLLFLLLFGPEMIRRRLPFKHASEQVLRFVPAGLAVGAAIVTGSYLLALHFFNQPLVRIPLGPLAAAIVAVMAFLAPFYQLIARACWRYGLADLLDPAAWWAKWSKVTDEIRFFRFKQEVREWARPRLPPLTCIAAVTASGFAMVRLPFWGVLHCAPLP
jgi:hypothetical protein